MSGNRDMVAPAEHLAPRSIAGHRQISTARLGRSMDELAAQEQAALSGLAHAVSPDYPPWLLNNCLALGGLMFAAGGIGLVAYDAVLVRLHAAPISLLTLFVIYAAATCSSVGGFAFSALCGAVLFRTLDTQVQAVEIMLICSIAIQSLSVLALRNEIDWRPLLQFLTGGVVGLPIGIHALLHLPKPVFASVFGALLIAYGTFMLFRPPLRVRADVAAWNVAAGAVGGVTGGLAAFPGAFVTIWCGLKGWNKSRQRGVYQPFILVMQILAVSILAMLPTGLSLSRSFDPGIVEYVPAALMGTVLGLWFFRKMTDRHFAIAVNILLVASGAGMLL